jgi:hypothetical protein
MSTLRGTKQWTVLVMGLKIGRAIFQRMMAWVLKNMSGPGWSVHVNEDDVIIGSEGATAGGKSCSGVEGYARQIA